MVNLPLNLPAGQTTFDVPSSSETLAIRGTLSSSGGGGIDKTGNGTLALYSGVIHSLPGTINVNSGTLQADASAAGANVTVNSGGRLSGVGAVSNVTANSDGALSPGSPASSIGTLTVGSLSLASGSTFAMQIGRDGINPISDRVVASGPVTLAGALSLSGSSLQFTGDQVTIIQNNGAAAVSGTFSGLPEGATLNPGFGNFQISYHGGDGNDVTLTAVGIFEGTVFNDLNHNGGRDSGEPALAGWTIQKYVYNGPLEETTTSDSNGYYRFVVDGRMFSACEALPAGWLLTTPGCYNFMFSGPGTMAGDFGNVRYTNLALVKSGPTSAQAGDVVVYQLNVSNNGPNPAAGVQVVDTLPANFSFTDSSLPAAWSCASGAGNTITCTRTGSLPIGSETLTLNVLAGYITSGAAVNSAVVSASTYDNSPTNDTSAITTTVDNDVDMAISKTTSTGLVLAGGEIHDLLTAHNNGTTTAYGVSVLDTMDPLTTFVAINGGGSTCSAPAMGANGPVSCTVGAVQPSGSATIELIVKVSDEAPAGSVISDTASVTTNNPDTDPGNDSAPLSLAVETRANLSASLSGQTMVLAGDQMDYQIVAGNLGPSGAANAIVTGTLPAEVTFIGASGEGWTCDSPDSQRRVVCRRLVMATGMQQIALKRSRLNSNVAQGSTLVNTVQIGSDTVDPAGENNSGSWTTQVGNMADLSVELSANPNPAVLAGDDLTYTIVVKNLGWSDAFNPQITDFLPSPLGFKSLAQPAGWNCTQPAVGESGSIQCSKTSPMTGGSQRHLYADRRRSGRPVGWRRPLVDSYCYVD